MSRPTPLDVVALAADPNSPGRGRGAGPNRRDRPRRRPAPTGLYHRYDGRYGLITPAG
ncbi:hypothetical protein ACIRRH_30905 [Kitasatospora sp. NPDC101235]|uniref:hypothetical protein n=1 Tax=Kitasatospora sp. NPDC101235 TaxID=3364101 RepID=UPI003825139C